MAAVYREPRAHTDCPACHARLRIRTELPEGSSVRCRGCQTSFRYYSRKTTTLGGGARGRQKTLDCPSCTMHFVADIAGVDKVRCPGCQAKIAIRRAATTRLAGPVVDVPRQLTGSSADRKVLENTPVPQRGRLNPAGFQVAKKPANTAPAKKSSGWVNSQSVPTPPCAHPRPSEAGLNQISIVVAVLVLLCCCYPICAYFFSSSPETRRDVVRGTVTLEGKPVYHGTVLLRGEDGVTLTGVIGPGGMYSVAGVPHGTVRIAVQGTPPPPGASSEEADVAPPDDWFPLPEARGNFDQSGLSVTVRGPTTHQIELK